MLKLIFSVILLLLLQGCGTNDTPTNGTGLGGSIAVNPDDCVQGIGCQISTMGNDSDDELLRSLHNQTKLFFGIDTQFGFYLEEDDPNAFANMDTMSIFFGRKLFMAMKSNDPTHYRTLISGIIAHEYGHIMQYNIDVDITGLAPTRQQVQFGSTILLSELEADAFSGFCMYFQLRDESQVVAYFNLLQSIGDTEYTSVDHHGTPDERMAAAAVGILTMEKLINENLLDQVDWSLLRRSFVYDIKTLVVKTDETIVNDTRSLSLSNLTPKEREQVRAIARGEITLDALKLSHSEH